MSLLRAIAAQLGLSNTAGNNFHWRAPDDGTARLSRGNSGAPIADVLRVNADNTLQAVASPAQGNRSLLLATMQTFAQEFGSSLTGNGWQRLPSGLIVQWGSVSIPPGGANVSFPIAFPTAAWAVNATVTDPASSASAAAGSIATTSANIRTSAGVTLSVMYIAIGH